MSKKVKIILYCILGIVLILVLCLMMGGSKHNAGEPDISQEDNGEPTLQTTGSLTNDYENTQNNTQSFEQDILNDLELFFDNSNGYENVQGDFGFIGTDN